MPTNWRSSYFRYKELFLNVSSLYKKRADLRAFLEMVLSIIAIMIFSVFAIKPTVITIIDLNKQIKEEKEVINTLNQKISNLQKAKSTFEQNKSSLEKIETAISSYPSPEIFVLQIKGIAARNNVDLVGLTIDDLVLIGENKKAVSSKGYVALPEGAKEMNYSINVRGNYTEIVNFLKEMENMRVISLMDNVTISSSVTDSNRIIVAIISGRVPFLENKSIN